MTKETSKACEATTWVWLLLTPAGYVEGVGSTEDECKLLLEECGRGYRIVGPIVRESLTRAIELSRDPSVAVGIMIPRTAAVPDRDTLELSAYECDVLETMLVTPLEFYTGAPAHALFARLVHHGYVSQTWSQARDEDESCQYAITDVGRAGLTSARAPRVRG